MNDCKKEFITVAVGVIEELNNLNEYCGKSDCKQCPLNLNPDNCNLIDKLKNNLMEGIEFVIEKLKQ